MNQQAIPDTGSNNQHAVSLYQDNGPVEDFPVLKAFQQYIDAEQAKARKRLITLGIFFSILIGAVIAVFVALLISMTQRNQTLNDRLVDFAMKERDRPAPPVVVQQPPQQQDNTAILKLTGTIEEMQQKLQESQRKAEDNLRKAEENLRKAEANQRLADENKRKAEEAERARKAAEAPKPPSPQELEIAKLKSLLAAEVERNKQIEKEQKEKAEAEKVRKRQEELENYRRKHYPELYETQEDIEDDEQVRPKRTIRKLTKKRVVQQPVYEEDDDDDLDDVIQAVDTVLRSKKARKYYDDSEESPSKRATKTPTEIESESTKTSSLPKKAVSVKQSDTSKKSAPAASKTEPKEAPKSVPADAAKKLVATAPVCENKVEVPPKADVAPKAVTSAVKQEEYVIPVDVKGRSSTWRIP